MHGTGDVSIPDAFTAFWVYNATSLPDPQICPWLVGVSGGTYGACRDDVIGANGQLYFSAWGNDYPSGYNIPINTARLWVDRLNTNKTVVEVSDETAGSRTNFAFNTSGLSTPAAGYYVGGLDQSVGSTGYPYRFAGDMAELIIYRGSLSDSDRTAVEQYLAAKYLVPQNAGTITYQWQFNGANVNGATNSTLTVANAQAGNGGTYDVVVCNANGCSTSANATLLVVPNACVSAPSGLIGQFVADGDAQDLTSTNRGTLTSVTFGPGVSGQAFQFSGNGLVTVPDSVALRPTSVSIVGWFSANAFNGLQVLVSKVAGTGTAESYYVGLDNGNLGAVVGDPAGIGNILEYPINPVPGQWYHFAFTFDDATKQQVLYLNGVALGSGLSGKSIGYDNHPLQIGAEFESQVLNFYLHGKMDEVALFNRALTSNEIFAIYAAGTNSICKPLQITTQPQNVTVGVGTNAIINIAATGQQPLSYQWFFGGTALAATNSSLTITNTQPIDVGSYSVVVIDTSGSLTSSAAVLTIGTAPSVMTQPASQTAVLGTAASFSVVASGSPTLGYQWKFNGTNISGATATSLTVTNVQYANAGNYSVVVTNAFGSATSSSAKLTVTSAPAISGQPSSQTVSPGSNVVFSVRFR